MARKKRRTVRQKDMPGKKKVSRYNFRKQEFRFFDEPNWLRCVVTFAAQGSNITIIWILLHYAVHSR